MQRVRSQKLISRVVLTNVSLFNKSQPSKQALLSIDIHILPHVFWRECLELRLMLAVWRLKRGKQMSRKKCSAEVLHSDKWPVRHTCVSHFSRMWQTIKKIHCCGSQDTFVSIFRDGQVLSSVRRAVSWKTSSSPSVLDKFGLVENESHRNAQKQPVQCKCLP